MTPEQFRALKFADRPRTDGKQINWHNAHFETFQILADLSVELNRRIEIIRETHPDKPTAVDFNVPGLLMPAVFMALDPRPASIGYYAGTYGPTYHIDLRSIEPGHRHARWMAIRPADEKQLIGFEKLIYSRTDDWLYLLWGQPSSFDCLIRVMALAQSNQVKTEGGRQSV